MPDSTVLTSREAIPDAAIRWFLLRSILIERLESAGEDYLESIAGDVSSLPADIFSEAQFVEQLEAIRLTSWERAENGSDDYLTNQVNDVFRAYGIEEIDEDSFERPTTVKYVTVDITVTLRVENSADEDDTENDVRSNIRVNDDYVDDSDNLEYEVTDITIES